MMLLAILKKEFLQTFRNKLTLRMVVAIPVIQLLVLPWAATFEQKNIHLSIVDHDHSSLSQRMIDKIVGSGYFRLSEQTLSYTRALALVEDDLADLVLELPQGFERDLLRGEPTGLMLSVNAVNGQKAGLGASYMGQILQDFQQEMLLAEGLVPVPTIQISPQYKFNREMNYRNYMIPGILVMLTTLVATFLAALNFVREKEIGTIEQINVTPLPKAIFILGKLVPLWILGFVILSIGSLVAWAVYGLVPAGSMFTIYGFAFFYLLAMSGLGLLLSTYSSSQQQAMFIALFFLIICFLLSGLFTPISSMPEWARWITRFNPMRYFVEVMRMVYMKGSSFADILPQVYAMLGFALVFNLWAVVSYRKTSA